MYHLCWTLIFLLFKSRWPLKNLKFDHASQSHRDRILQQFTQHIVVAQVFWLADISHLAALSQSSYFWSGYVENKFKFTPVFKKPGSFWYFFSKTERHMFNAFETIPEPSLTLALTYLLLAGLLHKYSSSRSRIAFWTALMRNYCECFMSQFWLE